MPFRSVRHINEQESYNKQSCQTQSDLRKQLDQYVPCVLYSEQLSGPITVKITQTLAFGLTKRSHNPDFKNSILGPRYRHFMSKYREN